MSDDKKIVDVTVTKEAGGVTATVTTSDGDVSTGRDHPSYHWDQSVSADRAIREAVKKANR